MVEPRSQPARTPWHLWVVGGVSLLWNAMGALDFTMTQTKNEAYMKAFTPEQLDYFYGFPLWVVLLWGISTWGSVLGSLLLLLRRRLARGAFLASLVAMIPVFVHNYVLTDGLRIMGGGAPVVFTAVIVVVAVLLLVYARRQAARGVLR
jgi:hypothetical protein